MKNGKTSTFWREKLAGIPDSDKLLILLTQMVHKDATKRPSAQDVARGIKAILEKFPKDGSSTNSSAQDRGKMMRKSA